MEKKDKLETIDELYKKARMADNFDWLDDIHRKTDCWEKTSCPMLTEIFNYADDNGYNEQRGYMGDVEYNEIKTIRTNSDDLSVDRVEPHMDGMISTWDVDVEIFVYKDYIYTISSEHINDAQTFTCQSITRRPLTITYT